MTLKQLIDVLWQRKWLIVAVIAIAMIIAALYSVLQVRTYASTESVRTSVSVTDAALGGQLGGVQVDFDPSTITSPKVLDQAAVLAGERKTDLSGVVSYDVQEGVKTNVLSVAAVAPTPAEAQNRASAVVKAYTTYLNDQVTTVLATLNTRAATATAHAVAFQKAASQDPEDELAASNLASALSTLGDLNNQIQTIQNSGYQLTPIAMAAPG